MTSMARYSAATSPAPSVTRDPQVSQDPAPTRGPQPVVTRPIAFRTPNVADALIPTNPIRVAVKCGGKILFLNPAEIFAAHAQGNYVLLQQNRGSHLLREQISVVAEKLAPFGFVRIHRSVLVNSAHVETIEPLFTGEYLLRLRGGREYNVTRTYKKNLQLLAESWIGTDSFVA
jgi:DNA-binding LytR/AlgR family response regulator